MTTKKLDAMISAVMSEMGKRRAAQMTTEERTAGGLARARALSPERRREIAQKAAKASAKVRTAKRKKREAEAKAASRARA